LFIGQLHWVAGFAFGQMLMKIILNSAYRWRGWILFGLGWLALTPGLAPATTVSWIGPSGSNWMTSTNYWSPAGIPGATDDVVIAGGGSIVVLTNAVTVQSVTISNRTLRFDVWTNYLTASNVSVQNGGTITHGTNTDTAAPWEENAGIFIACTSLTIQAGGAISADGAGYSAPVANDGYGPGRGYYSAALNYGGGGGYGGAGGYANADTAYGGATYGVATNPVNPGSGGAGNNPVKGSAGGGYLKIMASGTVTVDGLISMNGLAGGQWSGAGSGGGIFIQCGSLAGTGTIRADGGASTNVGGVSGSGGGGRIAIHAANAGSFGGQLSANCGPGYYSFPDLYYRKSAYPGTIYLSDWGILPVALTNGGGARCTAGTGTAGNVTISNYTLCLEWGWETNRLKAGSVTVQNTGKIMHVWNTATSTNASGEWVPNAGVFIECSNLTVQAGGEINGDGMGYGSPVNAVGYGPGRGSLSGNYGGGGGYGGLGGRGSDDYSYGGTTYGVATNPAGLGSGGGGSSANRGGAGGGYVKIVATGTVTVNGTISMKGCTNIASGGGGSGGGILIQCGTLAGNGAILADGGTATFGATSGGGGGGGRIAIHAANATSFGGQLSAKQGAGNFSFPETLHRFAMPGTIYLSDWVILPASLTNGGARFTAGTGTAGNVTISNYTLCLEWGWETNRLKAGSVMVRNNGKIMHMWNTATSTNASGEWVPNAGIFIECSSLTVQAGGEINGDSMGYDSPVNAAGYGPGRGSLSGNYGGGGGYGGLGGRGSDVAAYGGTNYGVATNPASLGSGAAGVAGIGNKGGSGGGYLKLVAAGQVIVDGLISMQGADGTSTAGGGSGGGILIQCGSLTGNGTIRANGGSAPSNGGGGGGGRIALYVRDAPFYTSGVLFTPTVRGGSGYSTGGAAGTIFYDFKPRGTMFSAW
jgi:hypothetical protein